MQEKTLSEKRLVNCFGTVEKCPINCKHKKECISKAREAKEEKQRKFHVPYSDEITKSMEGAESNDFFSEIMFDEQHDGEQSHNEIYGNTCIPGESKQYIRDFLERLIDIYRYKPKTFHMLMDSVAKNMNQFDVAKERGISRQSVNKALLKEIGIGRGNIQEYYLTALNGREYTAYLLCNIRKKSLRNAAREMKCSHMTVKRMLQIANSKLGKNVTVKN